MNWNSIKVFITGADGFIGSHLAEALVDRGATVTAMAQYNSWGSYGWLDDSTMRRDMKLVHGDVRDPEQMVSLVWGHDVVFHLAALISVPHSTYAARSYIDTNTHGTMNVLKASDHSASRVVITSSSEVYGTAKVVPIQEGHSLFPQSPYAASKVGADAIATAFHETHGIPVTILRPFNTYGPRQSERAIIPTIIRQAIDPRCPTIRLGSIDARRDLTYVTDTVAAFLAVADYDNPVCVGETYNAGAGKSITIGELAQYLRGDKEITHEQERDRGNEVWHLEAGCRKILQDTGWEPQVTLTDGLELTKKWWSYRLGDLQHEARYVI